MHFACAHREADTEHAGTEDDRQERTECHWEPRERREYSEDTEKDEGTWARHGDSISSRYDDHKFSTDRIGMFLEMLLHFCNSSRDQFLMYLGQFASDGDPRHIESCEFLK